MGWVHGCAAIAVAACGWIAVHGLSSARATAGLLPRTTLPWDADALPAGASDGRVLALRPTDDRARLRDLTARSGTDDGPGFRTAAAGVDRWARANPDGLFQAATVAFHRYRETKDPEDRRAGERLLLTFLRRTPAAHHVAGRLLRDMLGDGPPERLLSDGLPPSLAWWMAGAYRHDRPDVAWTLLLPALSDPAPLSEGAGRLALELAGARPDAATTAVLKALAARPDLSDGLRSETRAALEVRLRGVR